MDRIAQRPLDYLFQSLCRFLLKAKIGKFILENRVGNELLEDGAAEARRRLPHGHKNSGGDAAGIDLAEGAFDVVYLMRK